MLPRVLSAIDRDIYSPTRGCADRRFWAWKTVDFADATLQRTALLVHLASNGTRDSVLRAMLDFSAAIQHRDGSFDQAFPGEHSHGATAFLLSDLASIILDRPEWKNDYVPFLEKAGRFLIEYDEKHALISNHLAGAAAGLCKLHALTGKEAYRSRAGYYVNKVLRAQSAEGWYPEYGGADPSYLTLCTSYLAQVHSFLGGEELAKSLEKAIEFISYFCHPDGTFGGEYGSRSCEIFYAGSIGKQAPASAASRALLDWAGEAFAEGAAVTPLAVDLQNLTPVWSNVLTASRARDNLREQMGSTYLLPFNRGVFVKEFPEAGLKIVNTEDTYTIVSWKKGGVIKAFDKASGKRIFYDCGAVLERNGRAAGTTQQLSDLHRLEMDTDSMVICSPVFRYNQAIPGPWKMMVIRLLGLTLWKFSFFRELGKKLLVRFVITNKKRLPCLVERRVSFRSGKPSVSDCVVRGGKEWKIVSGSGYSALHMASSRYYPWGEEYE